MFKKLFEIMTERRQAKEAARKEYEERFLAELVSPDFDVIEELYCKPISASLRELYKNKEELQKSCISKVIKDQPEDQWIFICYYNPLNRKRIDEQWLKDGIHLAFAGDGSGSEYVVDPTDDQGVISFFDHESEVLKPTGVTIKQYLVLEDAQEET